MSIDNLTIGEAKQLASMFQPVAKAVEEENHGLCIVVLDKGFVYLGTLITGAKFITIDNAQCVRRWGTTNGLGELAQKGPQSNTVLDDACTVKALLCELKHFIICDGGAWENHK